MYWKTHCLLAVLALTVLSTILINCGQEDATVEGDFCEGQEDCRGDPQPPRARVTQGGRGSPLPLRRGPDPGRGYSHKFHPCSTLQDPARVRLNHPVNAA